MKIATIAGLCVIAMAAHADAAGPRRVLATIKSLESDKPAVQAYFNPKELSIDKSVPWSKDAGGSEQEPAVLYDGPAARSLDVLLSLEDKIDVRPLVEALEDLARPDENLKRPPRVRFVWGGLPTFDGVIESIGTKYTLFLPDGTPARAEMQVKFLQASRAGVRRACKQDEECPEQHACVQLTCQPR